MDNISVLADINLITKKETVSIVGEVAQENKPNYAGWRFRACNIR